jgi:hypothetical protein
MKIVWIDLSYEEIQNCIKALGAEISEFDCGERSKGWVTESIELITKLNSYLPESMQDHTYDNYPRL